MYVTGKEISPGLAIYTPPSLLRNQEIRNQGLNATQPYFFLSLRNEGLDLPEQICREMHLIYEFRRHSTIFRTEISSRIHFWGLEGPKMAKIDQKLRFSIKSKFSWGRPRSEPPARRRPPAPVQPPRASPNPSLYTRPFWPSKPGHFWKILALPSAHLISIFDSVWCKCPPKIG